MTRRASTARAPMSRASVQKRLRNVSSAARWAWLKTRGITRSAQPAARPEGVPHRRADSAAISPTSAAKAKAGASRPEATWTPVGS